MDQWWGDECWEPPANFTDLETKLRNTCIFISHFFHRHSTPSFSKARATNQSWILFSKEWRWRCGWSKPFHLFSCFCRPEYFKHNYKYILGAKTASEVEGAIFQYPAEFPAVFWTCSKQLRFLLDTSQFCWSGDTVILLLCLPLFLGFLQFFLSYTLHSQTCCGSILTSCPAWNLQAVCATVNQQ